MAKRNFLVDGLSGVGKSSVYEELVRRGFDAISSDRAWAYHGDPETGHPTQRLSHDTWIWDQQAAEQELLRVDRHVLFVCGSSRNSHRFLQHFEKVFILRIDDSTMRRRLEARTEEDWPLGQDGVEMMLELNRREERPKGSIDVDAGRPLDAVVNKILRLLELDAS